MDKTTNKEEEARNRPFKKLEVAELSAQISCAEWCSIEIKHDEIILPGIIIPVIFRVHSPQTDSRNQKAACFSSLCLHGC